MNYYNTKQWISYPNLIIPISAQNKKKLCLFFYGENTNFLNIYNRLGIKNNIIKRIFFPYITKPIVVPYTSQDRQNYLAYRLIPIKDYVGNYDKIQNNHFFFDTSKIFETFVNKFKPKMYNSGRGLLITTTILNYLNTVDSNMFEKVLLYCVDLNKPIEDKFFYKKIFPIFNILLLYSQKKITNLPFEKFFIFVCNGSTERYIKVWDINDKNNNINRLKNFILKISTQNIDSQEKYDIETLSTIALDNVENTNLVDKNNKEIIKKSIENYLQIKNLNIEDIEKLKDHNEDIIVKSDKSNEIKNISDQLITKSVLYNVAGKTEDMMKIIDKLKDKTPEEKQIEINDYSKLLVPQQSASTVTKNIVTTLFDPAKLVDFKSPGHIFQKRQDDFNKFMLQDMKNSFKLLENENPPLFLKEIKVKNVESSPSEIHKSLKVQYLIKLEDKNKNIHDIKIEFPRLTPEGYLLVNGVKKVCVNQLIKFPIFFNKMNEAKFESSYSVLKIISKLIKNGAYFQIFAGSYKTFLISLLAYKVGFKETCDKFNVKYEIIDEKNE